jgi:hypothetical protein
LLGYQLWFYSAPVLSPPQWSTLPYESDALPHPRWRLDAQFGLQCRHAVASTLCRDGVPLVRERRIIYVKFALPLSTTDLPPIATGPSSIATALSFISTGLPPITTGLPAITTGLPPIPTGLPPISNALPLDATTFLHQSRPLVVVTLPPIVFVLSWTAKDSRSTLPSF